MQKVQYHKYLLIKNKVDEIFHLIYELSGLFKGDLIKGLWDRFYRAKNIL